MTQQVLRPLRQWPWLHHRTCVTLPLHHHHHHHHLLTPPPHPTKTPPTSHRFSLTTLASSRPSLRAPNSPLPNPDPDPEANKSRNELKREAKRAVKWGMDLASFSAPQIKRILRVASLDQVVFEALMLVKRLRPDVREGRRRQFNYIGKLLREVDPELMDRLIKATKGSDQKELQALTGLGSEDDDDLVESESEEDEGESNWHDSQVTRWFDGLISKDIEITNEIYSVQGVEFDRQELRKLIRRVHITQEMKADNEEEEKKIETATIGAKKALTRFLRGLSKRIPNEY
ncbi:Ribosome-associated, YjgA [Spatholobus suberectus]|nr:Ribosome-associated, YjgA [Spatholobus suberectus]